MSLFQAKGDVHASLLPGSELSYLDTLTLAQCELLEATKAEPEGKGDCRLATWKGSGIFLVFRTHGKPAM